MARRGFAFAFVVLLGTVLFVAVFAYVYVVSTESLDTSNLVKAIHATAVADAVCATLVSMVNRQPWEDRFYATMGPEPAYAFSNETFPFAGTGLAGGGGAYEFAGLIKDVDAFSGTYRIYVEVRYLGHRVILSSDRQYTTGLLGAMNRDRAALTMTLARYDAGDEAKTDALLDAIKRIAMDASHLGLGPADTRTLADLADSLAAAAAEGGMPLYEDPILEDPLAATVADGDLENARASTGMPVTDQRRYTASTVAQAKQHKAATKKAKKKAVNAQEDVSNALQGLQGGGQADAGAAEAYRMGAEAAAAKADAKTALRKAKQALKRAKNASAPGDIARWAQAVADQRAVAEDARDRVQEIRARLKSLRNTAPGGN